MGKHADQLSADGYSANTVFFLEDTEIGIRQLKYVFQQANQRVIQRVDQVYRIQIGNGKSGIDLAKGTAKFAAGNQ